MVKPRGPGIHIRARDEWGSRFVHQIVEIYKKVIIFQRIKHRHQESYDEEATLEPPDIVEDPLSTTAQVTRQLQVGEVQSRRWPWVGGYNCRGHCWRVWSLRTSLQRAQQ